MTTMKAAVAHRLAFVTAALVLALFLTACAQGPLGSHGVDYIPAFDSPYSGGGGRGG
jgi:hypothetical protein